MTSNVHCTNNVPGTRILLWHLILVMLMSLFLHNFNFVLFIIIWIDFGVEQKYTKCYGPCNQGAAGAAECDGFCRAKNIQSKGTCSSGFCCCVWQIKN